IGGHGEAIFSPDSKTLVTTEEGGILRTWDVATGKGRMLGSHKLPICSMSFAIDGTFMTKGLDQTVRFWDLAKAKEKLQWPVPDDVGWAMLSPDGQSVVTSTWYNQKVDKRIDFFEAATGKPKKGWTSPVLKDVFLVRFSPNSKEILVSTNAGAVVWDPL